MNSQDIHLKFNSFFTKVTWVLIEDDRKCWILILWVNCSFKTSVLALLFKWESLAWFPGSSRSICPPLNITGGGVELYCTGPGASWTKVATSPSSLVNSTPLSVLSFLGAWVGFALGCWVITVCRRQYLSPLGISSALQHFSLQIHCVFSAVHTLNCGWLLYTQAVVFTRFKPSLKISA